MSKKSRWRHVMDNFQVVGKPKKGRRCRSSRDNKYNSDLRTSTPDSVDSTDFQNVQTLMDKIENCRKDIQCSQFFSDVKGLFNDDQGEHNDSKTLNKTDFKNIVCYGIGKLLSCPTARYQFALLLLLREFLEISGLCYIYEPCFSQLDEDVVRRFGCTLIAENEEGKRAVEEKTLFFMLHCGKPLYNNLLWSNWKPCCLSNIVILGNSFGSYLERLPVRKLREEATYIALILPHVVEVSLPNTFHYLDIFNDSSFHYFLSSHMREVPAATWTDCPEPHYDENDPEIVQTSRTARHVDL